MDTLYKPRLYLKKYGRQSFNELKHFEDVDVVAIDGRDVVDVIIGNDKAFLMTVIEEKRGESPDEPQAI